MIHRRDPLTEYDDGSVRHYTRPFGDPTERSMDPRPNPDTLEEGPYRNLIASVVKTGVDDLLHGDKTVRAQSRHWVNSPDFDELASWLGYEGAQWRAQLYRDGKMEQRPEGTKTYRCR